MPLKGVLEANRFFDDRIQQHPFGLSIGAATMFMLSRSANEQHQEATTSAGLSPINAETGIAVGDKIPDFDIQLNNGNIVSAANLVAEGKPTFYFFFATW